MIINEIEEAIKEFSSRTKTATPLIIEMSHDTYRSIMAECYKSPCMSAMITSKTFNGLSIKREDREGFEIRGVL